MMVWRENMGRFKYPRTRHLPWSPGRSHDDLTAEGLDAVLGERVVVTEKMDGENTTLYRDHAHARSLDSRHHPSRDWVKGLHGSIAHEIPAGWRLCGENVYARHSIAYGSLPSYFLLFSIWDDANRCLDWDTTREWAALLGLHTVPVLYDGEFDEDWLRALDGALDLEVCEGYVVRLAASFAYADFGVSVAKWVRRDHVQTDQHWMQAEVVPNGLAPLPEPEPEPEPEPGEDVDGAEVTS